MVPRVLVTAVHYTTLASNLTVLIRISLAAGSLHGASFSFIIMKKNKLVKKSCALFGVSTMKVFFICTPHGTSWVIPKNRGEKNDNQHQHSGVVAQFTPNPRKKKGGALKKKKKSPFLLGLLKKLSFPPELLGVTLVSCLHIPLTTSDDGKEGWTLQSRASFSSVMCPFLNAMSL